MVSSTDHGTSVMAGGGAAGDPMSKHRVSRARQLRRLLVRMYGRIPVRRPRRPEPEPAFRKITPAEVLQFHAWKRRGWSARKIGRRCGRDHHTVLRWFDPSKSMPTAAVEACLAHVVKDKAEAAYFRSDLFEMRRDLMEKWARMAMGETAVVLQIGA